MFSTAPMGTSTSIAPSKTQLGQFFTPKNIAHFMANQFEGPFPEIVRLLDAGAGDGSLTVAFIERWREAERNGRLVAHAYEFDDHIASDLRTNLAIAAQGGAVEVSVFDGDFIQRAATMVRLQRGPRYTHAILNPPYKKISSASAHRSLLSAIGLETVNLYSGFVGLAVELLEPGGEIVAIIPRSFCNGPYYRPFRHYILKRAAIRQIHLFEARNKAFKDDSVLQENVIIRLERGAAQGDVVVSTSHDNQFTDYETLIHPFSRIVFPDDAGAFIHVPTGDDAEVLRATNFRHTLSEIGVNVSTGPVVDFRMRDDLRADPEPGAVPLLYPGHFSGDSLFWPREGFKKPNAIRHNRQTEKWLYPGGFYAVVRRFSSKEERRRIVASVVDPTRLPPGMIGFENHLNVFHGGRRPLPEDLARGLTLYLNTTPVDRYFRRFNGHTQVNATDLRTMRYPSRDALSALGGWAKRQLSLSQSDIDARVAAIA